MSDAEVTETTEPGQDQAATSTPTSTAGAQAGQRRLVVMQSFSRLTDRSNPYLSLLVTAVSAEVDVVGFSWRRALLGRWDVLHLHWPELVFRRAASWRTAVLGALLLVVVLRARLTGRAIVRTVHNPRPHDTGARWQGWLLAKVDAATSGWVLLNPFTTPPGDAPAVVIVHGHYRDWYAQHPEHDPEQGRLVFFGLVRRYKGVVGLLDAFSTVPDAHARLHVVGAVDGEDLLLQLESAAVADPRVVLALGHASDAALAEQIHRAQLVVLPYRELHNSGAVLLALSLGRPVLVPDNAVTAALAAEVGDAWVLRYQGQLRSADIVAAMAATRVLPGSTPDLTARDWPELGRQHVALYRAAVATSSGGRR